MSATSALKRLMPGAPETRAPMGGSAERAGTATFVIATALATSVQTVRKVRVSEMEERG